MNSLFNKDFALSIGPQRCGTNWLERYMRFRGDVCLPESVKEVFFFDRHYHRGPEFYQSHFNPSEHHRLVMEMTTTAFDVPEAPRNVYNMMGKDIKLICPLRDPVKRSLAVYQDYLHYGIVSGSIAAAVEQAPQILFASRYAEHLERWLDRFGKERLEVVFYETLEEDAGAFTKQACEFLKLPFMIPPPGLTLTPSPGPAKTPRLSSIINLIAGRKSHQLPREPAAMSLQIAWLQERLGDEQNRLEKLLGRVIPRWSQ